MKHPNWKIIVGTGNPGKEYERTYHNIGIAAVEKMSGMDSDKFKKPFSIRRGKSFGYFLNDGTVYVRPLTYMNESGRAVSAAAKYFDAKPENILVIHDDSDIETGKYKLDFGRGSAGHNGVRSIMEYLGTENFWRLRIGIRGEKKGKAGDFVLDKITPEDRILLERVLVDIKARYSERHGESRSSAGRGD